MPHITHHRRRLHRQHMHRQPGLLALGFPGGRIVGAGGKQRPAVKADPRYMALTQAAIEGHFSFPLGEEIRVTHFHRAFKRCR